MEILLWLVPSLVATLLAMLWAGWAGRRAQDVSTRPEREQSQEAYERFARAITKQHPAAGRPKPVRERDRSTGIAVRPSRRAS